MKRLSLRTLATLPRAVATPGFDTTRRQPGIIHLGVGAFHRAHQAVYTDDILSNNGGNWRITGVSLRQRTAARQLNPQDGLYTLAVKSSAGTDYRVIGSITGVIYAPHEHLRTIAEMASPSVHVVTLTVTEKGYCHDPATGRLNTADPAITADISGPDEPQSMLGFLTAALDRRRRSGIPPFTVLSCDNLRSNGSLLKSLAVEHAALRDGELAEWIDQHVLFPSTMIDRIVPATSNEDRSRAALELGVDDHGLVVAEPFSQWVIEDRFSGPRPAWEYEGVQLVSDVRPFELAKLRMLNGAHSTIAYMGCLAGYEFVHEAMRDAHLRRLIDYLLKKEIAPTLRPPWNLNVDKYRTQLLARFSNPALKHRTRQIAMDGSQKLPPRLLGTVRDRLARNAPIRGLCLSVAAWVRYINARDEDGLPTHVEDPMADRLAILAADLSSCPGEALKRILGVAEIFGDDLASHPAFFSGVLRAVTSLLEHGARKTIARFSAALD